MRAWPKGDVSQTSGIWSRPSRNGRRIVSGDSPTVGEAGRVEGMASLTCANAELVFGQVASD